MKKLFRKKFLLLFMIAPLLLTMSPPTGIAQQDTKSTTDEVYSTDFSEYDVGKGVPKGWKQLWRTSLYEVDDSPSRLIKRSTKEARHLLAWEDVGEVEGDVEVATLMRVPGETISNPDVTSFQLHLHAGGQTRAIDTYHLDYTGTDRSGLRIRRSVHNDQTTLASNKDASFELHTWHNVVFQRKGDMLRAKVWPYNTEEPDEWTVEAEDDTHHSGYVGPGFYSERSTQEFAWFSVGTGDENAERAPEDLEDIAPPQKPVKVDLDGEAKYESIVLDWPEAEGADYYEVERDGELITRGWDPSSYSDYTIPPETSATYRVRGVSTVKGKGEWSEPIKVTSEPIPDELALPFEQEDDHPWTMHERELEFLEELEDVSPRVKVEEIGRSGEDRPIHVVRYGAEEPPTDEEFSDRPVVWLSAGTHGDEKGSQEGMLFFMRRLATSDEPEVLDFLNKYAVIVIPKNNPDGAEHINRWTTDPAMDPNRDFVKMETNETRVLNQALLDYKPDFVMDAHEWAGSPASNRGELEISTHGNLNSHVDVRNLSQELAFDEVMKASNDYGGYRSQPYQELYGEPSRLRQIGGPKHALTLLSETSRHPDVRRLDEEGLDQDANEYRPRRASATHFALDVTMNWLNENVDRVVEATNASKEAAETNTGPLYSDGSVEFPPTDEQVVDPPCGWLVSNADSNVTDILDLHGIEWEKRDLPKPQSMEQEVLFVPAAQLARPLAFITLDGSSPDQLSTISSLRLTEDSGWCDPETGDKTALENRVTEIKDEDLNEADYTEESWQNLQDALSNAEEVLDDSEATQSEIDDALETLNEARDQLEEISEIRAADIKEHVDQLDEDEEFDNDKVVRSLKSHLTAVTHFEDAENADKIVKHMEGFITLLEHYKENEEISKKAYNSLKEDADTLIEQWQ